jgi:F-type H+-transporting ATPase subunit 8
MILKKYIYLYFIFIKMPQLIPFFFVNQVIFTFIILIVLIYIFTKYILPKFVRIFISRIYINKL